MFVPIPISQINYPAQFGVLFEINNLVIPGQCSGYNYNNAWTANSAGGYAKCWYSTSDSNGLANNGADFDAPDTRHFGGCNVGFYDGHVKWLPYNSIYFTPPGVTASNFRLWHPKAA